MKFGSEFTDRSILKWRNYNLDYNDLKAKIKAATAASPHSSTLTLTTLESQDERAQVRAMKQLFAAFKDQIEFVSLFVNSKYGEFQTRLQALASRFDRHDQLSRSEYIKLQHDTVELSLDFQRISRFIMLQKLALRKLFKKFLKHSNYRYKEEFVERVRTGFLEGNPHSFVNLDMSESIHALGTMLDYINDSGKASGTDAFVKFDLESIQRASNVEVYWIHEDNLAELKLNLISNFKSSMLKSEQTDMWLYNLDNVDIRDYNDIPCTITSYSSSDTPLVLTPTGGLRQVSYTMLAHHSVPPVEDWSCSPKLHSKMSAVSLEFVKSRGYRPIAKSTCEKLRCKTADSKVFITLQENIRTSKDNLSTLAVTESDHFTRFPFALLEIRYESKNAEVPKFISELSRSHLCYRVDPLNFSMLNYLIIKYYPDRVDDEVFVRKFDWFKDFNKDIRMLPAVEPRPKPPSSIRSNASMKPASGILLNKSKPKSQVSTSTHRYWNEFDDDPEFENSELVVYYDDDADSTGLPSFKWLLTPDKVNSIWSVSRFFRRLFKIPSKETEPLISKGSGGLKYTRGNGSDSDSTDFDDEQFRHLRSYSPPPKSRVLLQEQKHDQVVTFLYMLCLSLSCLTCGVAIGMFATMVSSVGGLKGVWNGANSNATIMLVVITLITFALALVLCIFSVCLMFNRHSSPPVWHQILVWSAFTVTSCVLVIGICLCIE